MHWKTKDKLKRSVNEKIAQCPDNKAVWNILTEEERLVYAERFTSHWALSDRHTPFDWLTQNR